MGKVSFLEERAFLTQSLTENAPVLCALWLVVDGETSTCIVEGDVFFIVSNFSVTTRYLNEIK